MAKTDLTGQKFERLTVIREVGRTGQKQKLWLCQCECGNFYTTTTAKLNGGIVKSCGCLRKDILIKRNFKHGKANTRLFRIWKNIKLRCTNKNYKAFKYYGARGISICEEWRDFQSFYNWAMAHGYEENLTIDRIDNDGDYSPENCRWVTNKIQQRNKRTNRILIYNGESHPLIEWAEILGINAKTLKSRIDDYQWPIEKALSVPVRPYHNKGGGIYH